MRYGRKLRWPWASPDRSPLFAPDGEFLALYEQDGELARAVAVFC